MSAVEPVPGHLALAAPPGAVRAGVLAALQGSSFEVLPPAGDAEAAAALVEAERPAILVVDDALPGGSLTLMSRVSRDLPECSMVLLAAAATPDRVVDAVRAGAMGFLPPSFDPLALPRVLAAVLRGEAAIPRDLVYALAREVQRARDVRRERVSATHGSLTDREWAVLVALEEGRSTAEIAVALGISPVTVRRHVTGAVTKLGVGSREAAIEVLRGRLAPPGPASG